MLINLKRRSNMADKQDDTNIMDDMSDEEREDYLKNMAKSDEMDEEDLI
jgi:hypothetical protein